MIDFVIKLMLLLLWLFVGVASIALQTREARLWEKYSFYDMSEVTKECAASIRRLRTSYTIMYITLLLCLAKDVAISASLLS